MTLIRREDIEARERLTLACYAALAANSRGRVFPQPEHPLRTAYQRDRDRIVHSAAFRRMEYKTQVFIPHLADHFRTRLTHTIEVAQISRTLARNLRLNEDLTEAIALVHDLGHTPFGHSGEDVLNELLADFGGFNHNRQTLRVVDLLEERYPDHPGLNLTYEVREGIVKHETRGGRVGPEFHPEERPTLEAALVDKADELAYMAHDIDDGLNSGLITLEDIRPLAIWDTPGSPLKRAPEFNAAAENDRLRYELVRYLINTLATDLLDTTSGRLSHMGIADHRSLRLAPGPMCVYSDSIAPMAAELKQLLNTRLYRHPRLVAMADQAQRTIRKLFRLLTKNPRLMPPRYQVMIGDHPLEIVAADYLAGMTDRFAEKLAQHPD
ncbi:MAG: deoxyguanosinetriphosphate triphosphohydrolase [Candidatus Zixiibacteriota bacterium]